jgi:hypothetical protein
MRFFVASSAILVSNTRNLKTLRREGRYPCKEAGVCAPRAGLRGASYAAADRRGNHRRTERQ